MHEVKFGVVGCGVIGPQHMESIQELPGCRLIGVADVDEERAVAARERFSADQHFTDPVALINNPEIEAVVLALPAGLRADLAVECVSRGKHVMLEKPPARNVAEYDAIGKAVEKFKAENPDRTEPLVANASARYMLTPHSGPTRDYITSGALGEIRSIHFRNLVPPGPPPSSPPPAWRVSHELNGGGILVNWSSYELDYIFGMVDWALTPKHVLARWWGISPQLSEYVAPGSDADEHFAAMIACEEGTTIYLERGERVAGPPRAECDIIGSKASVSLTVFPEDYKRIVAVEYPSRESREIVVWEGSESWRDSRIGIIRDFASAIANNNQPQTNLARGRVMQQVIDSIYRSGSENRPVDVR